MADVKDFEKDIDKCKSAIRAIKAETVQLVSILPSGKSEVVDNGRLEALNSEAARLHDLEVKNSEVLEKLRTTLGGFESARKLYDQIGVLKTAIERAHNIYRVELARHLKDFRRRSRPVDLENDPKALSLKAERDEKLKDLEPELKRLELAGEAAREIISEFQPSGLPDAVMSMGWAMSTFR